jgi:hypothetical protein
MVLAQGLGDADRQAPRHKKGNGLGADSGEKHEPVSDIDTVSMGSLIALDPNRPIREADTAPRIYEYTL